MYVVELSQYEDCEVRRGLARYGADAYFHGETGKLKKIMRQGVCYYPGDAGFKAAAFAFRSTLAMHTFVLQHAGIIHLTYANMLDCVTREKLLAEHPVRALLGPFIYGSVAINFKAIAILVNEMGLVHRAYAFTKKGLEQAFEKVLSLPRRTYLLPSNSILNVAEHQHCVR